MLNKQNLHYNLHSCVTCGQLNSKLELKLVCEKNQISKQCVQNANDKNALFSSHFAKIKQLRSGHLLYFNLFLLHNQSFVLLHPHM